MVTQTDKRLLDRLMSAIPRSPVARKILEQDAQDQESVRASLLEKKAKLEARLEAETPPLLKAEAAAKAKYEAALKAADKAREGWQAATRERLTLTWSISNQIIRLDGDLTASAGDDVDELIGELGRKFDSARQAPLDGETYDDWVARVAAVREARTEAQELKTRSAADIAEGIERIRAAVLA